MESCVKQNPMSRPIQIPEQETTGLLCGDRAAVAGICPGRPSDALCGSWGTCRSAESGSHWCRPLTSLTAGTQFSARDHIVARTDLGSWPWIFLTGATSRPPGSQHFIFLAWSPSPLWNPLCSLGPLPFCGHLTPMACGLNYSRRRGWREGRKKVNLFIFKGLRKH